MANRLLRTPQVLETAVVKLYGSFVTSTSGTVSSTSCKGFTIAKTAGETGRYTITLADSWTRLLAFSATLVGAADAAMTSAKGLVGFLRNVDTSSAKTLDVQFCDPDGSPADAELADGVSVLIELTLKNSSAY